MKTVITLLIGVLWATTAVSPVIAEANTDVVRAYRIVVPDYSKTSGGTSPVLSPDGDTLAYMSDESKVWILHGLAGNPEKTPEPWKLQFDLNGSYSASPRLFPPRNLDWSPDGKRLAIAFTSGRVYVVENFDFDKKTADVRQVGNDSKSDDGKLHSPRWSPDGTKIAVGRNYLTSAARLYGAVSIIDADSGVEAVIAKDAGWYGELWAQPWSPDGKSIVYSSGDSSKTGESTKYNIWVVSIDGKNRKQITTDNTSNYPSWSPNSEKIAFCSNLETKVTYPGLRYASGYSSPAVWITDSRGSKRKSVSPVRLPTKEQIATASITIRNLMTRDFRKNYGTALTPAQQKQLEQGKLTPEQMQNIALATEAKKIGGEFQKLVEVYLQTHDPKQKGESLMKAFSLLPPDAFSRLAGMVMGMSSEEARVASLRPLVESDIPHDKLPVWSPDGKKLAFLRESLLQDRQSLYILDIAGGKSSVAYTAGEISNISWTRCAGSIVLESKRFVSLRHRPAKPGEPAGYDSLVTTPGYPEVWELKLK